MSPDMLTLVAEVLATDLVFDSVLENDRCDLLSSRSLSRNAMSETRDEKDMVAICCRSRESIKAVWVRAERISVDRVGGVAMRNRVEIEITDMK